MFKLMLFGENIKKNCEKILSEQLPNSLEVENFKKYIPLKLLAQISPKDEFILLKRKNPEEFCCIFNAANKSVSSFAQKNKLRTLTCGFSPYDTIIFSSVNCGEAVVSLQREIFSVKNRIIEPCDCIVHTSKNISQNSLLFCVAALLLSDNFSENPVFYF